MSIWYFLKIFGDCCLCFSILGAFPTLLPHSFSLLLPALMCALGAGAAVWLAEMGKFVLRFLALLLPLSSLILAPSPAQALILLPPIAYTAVVIIRCELALEYYTFRQFFQRSLIGLTLFFVVIFVLFYFERAMGAQLRGKTIPYDPDMTLLYGILYAAAGIVLLRQLRLGLAELAQNRGMNLAQIAAVFGGTGACVLACMAAERLLRQRLSQILLQVLGRVFGPVLMLYDSFTDLKSDYEDYTVETATQAATEAAQTATTPTFQSTAEQTVSVEPEQTFPWVLVLVLAGVIIVMVLMLRSFHTSPHGKTVQEKVEKMSRPESKAAAPRRSNRSRVRKYYRDFLKGEKRRGMKLRQDQTSLDILQNISPDTEPDAAARLRQIYLAARYDPECEITPEQAAAAKNALKQSH